jgi:hypothetical protein
VLRGPDARIVSAETMVSLYGILCSCQERDHALGLLLSVVSG